ncbi:MAG: hypothetical protein N3D82_02755 [Ignisphaera sp.]|nr:hypothetical protein [Ignisphaera sp.]MCX8167939.1 hypothetical protein [Ignisphaera sp.]MDW8086254.1 hypothetical protein [Ignisphaera sp.]
MVLEDVSCDIEHGGLEPGNRILVLIAVHPISNLVGEGRLSTVIQHGAYK